MKELLYLLGIYLGYVLKKNITPKEVEEMDTEVKVTYERWEDIVYTAIKSGIKAGKAALEAVKEEIVKACRRNKNLLRYYSQLAIKTSVRLTVEVGAKYLSRALTKESAKQIVAQGAKALGGSHLVVIAADVAQAGLEHFGYEDIGKTVGTVGNVVSGIFVGAAVGGPPGAVIGGFCGLLVWGVGEITGGLVKRAFGDEQPPKKP